MSLPDARGGKRCIKCKWVKPIGEFHKSANTKGGLRNQCKSCYRAHVNAWKSANPDLSRAHKWKNRYGITDVQYAKMFQAQHGQCKICGSRAPEGKLLLVDHDHETGVIRGLLCNTCNLGIANFKDDPSLLIAASTYLSGALRNVIA